MGVAMVEWHGAGAAAVAGPRASAAQRLDLGQQRAARVPGSGFFRGGADDFRNRPAGGPRCVTGWLASRRRVEERVPIKTEGALSLLPFSFGVSPCHMQPSITLSFLKHGRRRFASAA